MKVGIMKKIIASTTKSVTSSYFFDYLEPITEAEYESILDGQKIGVETNKIIKEITT